MWSLLVDNGRSWLAITDNDGEDTPQRHGECDGIIEMEWNGIKCNEIEWHGMKWNDMEWNGMTWNEMEWHDSIVCYGKNWVWYDTVIPSHRFGKIPFVGDQSPDKGIDDHRCCILLLQVLLMNQVLVMARVRNTSPAMPCNSSDARRNSQPWEKNRMYQHQT